MDRALIQTRPGIDTRSIWLEDRVYEGGYERYGLQEYEQNRGREQDEKAWHHPPKGSSPHVLDQLQRGSDASLHGCE